MERRSVEFRVTNRQPETSPVEMPEELALFRRYLDDPDALPLEHQAEAWRSLREGTPVTLVAGTAAGKTLAAAVPLICALAEGRVDKVCFLYPTIALMEDQLRVLLRLAALAGLEGKVGVIRGGLSRGALMEQLTRRLLLATPDAVYWFLRKEVKYNSLLIYSLTQVDEFVLDEAHLFDGLMQDNLRYFFSRLETLRVRYLGRRGVHPSLLTATPGGGRLPLNSSSEAVTIYGRSRCGDVWVRALPAGRFEGLEVMENEVDHALAKGIAKVLVIVNSAAQAHRLFAGVNPRRSSLPPDLPAVDLMRLGRLQRNDLLSYLVKVGFSPAEIAFLFSPIANSEEKLGFADFRQAVVAVEAETVHASLMSALGRLKGQVMQAVYWTFRQEQAWEKELPTVSLVQSMTIRHQALPQLLHLLWSVLPSQTGYMPFKSGLADAFAELGETLAGALEEGPRQLTYPGLPELSEVLGRIWPRPNTLPEVLWQAIAARFSDEFRFLRRDILESHATRKRRISDWVYLRWLTSSLKREQPELAALVEEHVLAGLAPGSGLLRPLVDMHYLGAWKDSGYPVILYSGSMTHLAREGMVPIYQGLEKAVLISTSAVEVGVDFDADLLITDECEGSSILQRFGRVGRSGRPAQAVMLLNGTTHASLEDSLGGAGSLEREQFSRLVENVFPHKCFSPDSDLLAAAHWQLNKQLGIAGEEVNHLWESGFLAGRVTQVAGLAAQLHQADINLAYGLRGSLPAVELRDRGVAKSPFYLCQYIPDEGLLPADSTFSVAKAGVYFEGLIHARRQWRVGVDVKGSAGAARGVVTWNGSAFRVTSLMPGQGLNLLARAETFINTRLHKSSVALLYGDVYMERHSLVDELIYPIKDRYGQPLILADQFYLVFPGRTGLYELEALGLDSLSEIYYDVDFEGHVTDGSNLVLLEEVQGACLAVWRAWLFSQEEKEAP